jgi:sugar phosphate isomerase/epimerase
MDADRLTACTFPLREKPLGDAFGVIKNAGFDQVDLLARMPHFSVTDPDYSLDELERQCEVHGIRVANLGAYCGRGFSSEEDGVREEAMNEMELTLAAGKRLGVRTIRVTPGNGKRDEIDALVPPFQESARMAEAAGLYLGIENHGTEISGNPEACLEICKKVGSKHFGILYEPCNLMAAGIDYQEAFDILQDHVVHVHVKDGAHDGSGKWSRTMLGEGEIDYLWVYDQVEAIGYTGEYALEYEVPKIEAVETGYKKWRDYWLALPR